MNSTLSVSFLEFLYPEGPWVITAISVDKKRIRAKACESRDEILEFLQEHDQFNLYYSVNQPTEEGKGKTKLSKTDVASVHFLHVDVDPRANENVKDEQERILKQLESYTIRPSCVIFSGGGYNALWRLEEPFHINGEVARAIDVERRNWQMELDFDTPDHCRDVSRILRLPGTINRPDEKKKAKGRVEALAGIVWMEGTEYPLSKFGATPHVAANEAKTTTVTLNAIKTESIDSLDIPNKLKIILAQGHDPDEKWDGDRSKVLYKSCCDMVRAGLKDEEILGIITDSRHLISASVLDKGSGVMRYALRQVQRARDNAFHPMLEKMNDQYSIILSYGNQTVVMVERGRYNETTERYEPVFQTFRSFRDRIKHLPAIEIPLGDDGKSKKQSVFDWWTSHARRREYEDVTFEPGLDTPHRYNMWTGFAVQPVTGNAHESYLAHIYENICNNDAPSYEYLINWMARVVQEPRTRSMVVPVLLGERGTGKSVFADYFGALFEPHRFTASDIHELTGKFNAHLGSCVYVVAEEAFDLRDKRHESVLKERVTGRTISIERKGLDKIQVPNYIHLIMTSNNERVVPAGDHERRFFVLRVNNQRMQDSEYFRRILDDQKKGGLKNLLRSLLERDISKFDVTRFPRTKELREQQEHNLTLELKWLLEKLEYGEWLKDARVRWEGPVPKRTLYEDYKEYMFGLNAKFVKGERSFHKFIFQEFPGTIDKQLKIQGRPMAFVFEDLSKCRSCFDRNRGWNENWRAPLEVSEEPPAEVIPINRKPFE